MRSQTVIEAPEWAPPPGYSRYQASRKSRWTRGEDGRRPVLVSGGIRNPAGVLLRPRPNNSGHLLINLVDDHGVKRTLTVHKAILLAHAGEPGPGEEALHEDDDPYDNRYPEKLYWGTRERNLEQQIRNQRRRRPWGPGRALAFLRRTR